MHQQPFNPGKNPLLTDILCRLSKLNGLGKALLGRVSAACHYLGNPDQFFASGFQYPLQHLALFCSGAL